MLKPGYRLRQFKQAGWEDRDGASVWNMCFRVGGKLWCSFLGNLLLISNA